MHTLQSSPRRSGRSLKTAAAVLLLVIVAAVAATLLWRQAWSFFAVEACLGAGGRYSNAAARCEYDLGGPRPAPGRRLAGSTRTGSI
jgi:hypothetical protein